MRWKTILRFGIIIYTFFMITIECKTNIRAMDNVKNDFYLVEICDKQDCMTQDKKMAEGLPFCGKTYKTIKIFFGDFDIGKVVCKEYFIIKDLDETDEELLTRLLKIQPGGKEEYILGIPNNSYIENIELNLEEDIVLINMAQSYQLTNFGSLGEYLALQSLVSTVMDYYNVQAAAISINGKPYCSGHFCFETIHRMELVK